MGYRLGPEGVQTSFYANDHVVRGDLISTSTGQRSVQQVRKQIDPFPQRPLNKGTEEMHVKCTSKVRARIVVLKL